MNEAEQVEIDLLHKRLSWFETHCVAVIDDTSSEYWTPSGYAVPIRNFEQEAKLAKLQLKWSIEREEDLERRLLEIQTQNPTKIL